MSQKSDSSYNSSGCSTSESESNEETYDLSNLCKDFKKSKPYDYEPLVSPQMSQTVNWSQTVKFQMIPVNGRNHGVNEPNARLCKRNEKVGAVRG